MALRIDDKDFGTVLLSPMAGVTDTVYRRLCKRMGAETVYTEFVSSDGIIRNNQRTLEMLEFAPEERPLGIQLFGGAPAVVAEAARDAWAIEPDLIDINFGCPAKKVTKKMAGCAILQDLGLYREVIAVPTSVGYGAGAGGWAALLGMLSSCASGVVVVNIDNGFGAAYAAARILMGAPGVEP